MKAFVKTLKDKKIALDPTLATLLSQTKDGEINEPFATIASHMPPDVSRGFSVGTMKIKMMRRSSNIKSHMQRWLNLSDVCTKKVCLLSLAPMNSPALPLHSELGMLVKAGLTPAQSDSSRDQKRCDYTRTEADRGSIKVGKLADLVLVDGDPTKDIEDLRKVSAVITRGHLMYPQEIHQTMGITIVYQQRAETSATCTCLVQQRSRCE